jgi:hypothetical protein
MRPNIPIVSTKLSKTARIAAQLKEERERRIMLQQRICCVFFQLLEAEGSYYR